MTWSLYVSRFAAVGLLVLMGCGAPAPPVMPAPVPEPAPQPEAIPEAAAEAMPEPRVRQPIPIEERIRSPFAVQSDGRPTPRYPRQNVVVLEQPTPRAAVARAARDTTVRDTASRDTAAAPAERTAQRAASTPPSGNGARTPRAAAGTSDAQRTAAPAQGSTPPAAGTPPGRAAAPREHTVAVGETFYGIARRYGVTPSALSAVNPGTDTERLRAGQVLQLPAYATRPDTTGAASDTAAADTARARPSRTPAPAQPPRATQPATQRTPPSAQRPPASRTPQRRTHTVRSGETLWSISRRYGVTPQQIRTANRMTSDLVRIGQTLVIPNS